MPSRGCGRGHPQQARGRRATSDEWCEIDGQRRWWWGRFEMRNNVRTEQRGDGESVCFRKQDDSWFTPGSESQKAAVLEGGQLGCGGKGRARGPIYCPRAIWHPGWLLQCALPRTLAHTRRPGPTAWCRRRRPRVPHHQDTVASWPPCNRGRVIEEKSVEPEVGWLLSLQGGRGPIPAPRRRPLRPVAWRHNSLMRSGRPFCRARNGASPLNPPRRRHPLRTSNVGIGTTTTCST